MNEPKEKTRHSIFRRSLFLKISLATVLLSASFFVAFKLSSLNKGTFDLSSLGSLGQEVEKDFSLLPTIALAKNDNGYELKDTNQAGIQIDFASETEEQKKAKEENKREFKIEFPNDYLEPIRIKLDEERIIQITDQTKEKFKSSLLARKVKLTEDQEKQDEQAKKNQENDYLLYRNSRKSIYYAYQKDTALDERKLKNWIIYEKSNDQEEKESYQISNAKIKKNGQGQIEVFYFGDKELQNEKTMAEVDQSLLDRAQRTIEKDMGEDILNNQTPDFVIPEPYYLNKEGERINLEWNIDTDKNIISLGFTPKKEDYPIALDPTLQFTAPGVANGGDVITGEASSRFGYLNSITSGDFNADGRTDLAVGAYNYSTGTGRVYIFYNDGTIPTAAASADVIITGEEASSFGASMVSGDFNADGKTDLAVGAKSYPSYGRVYIFYNDGSYPSDAVNADIIITGEEPTNFGNSLVAGDFNSDGKIDLAVGSNSYATVTGRVYVFYNDGSYPSNAADANVIITGETTINQFGYSMVSGDFNADGKTDLAVCAYGYSNYTGRVYIFYNDGSYPSDAAAAEVIITGETTSNNFGYSMTSGDFNSDGKTDIAVGAYYYSTFTGRAYIFYNDGSIPTSAASADVIITGETTSNDFGISMTSGDFNSDGRTDMVVGADRYSSYTGRAYIFYNDGSIPTTAATADVIITGESTNNNFGVSMVSGDFNSDGKTDLAVGAYQYSSYAGRAYIFYSQNGQVNTNFSIAGETSSYFGYSMTSGDFNADGKIDLAVGAPIYSSNAGRTYIFYNDGSISAAASSADVTIAGEASSYFGSSMTSGDFNADGKIDLAVGAVIYSSNAGRAYIFYNDGSIPTAAASADVIIAGEATSNFTQSMEAGDLNADGRTDLVIGAQRYGTYTGRAYIFYNDGSIPTAASSADLIITGETSAGSYFGSSVASGDFNSDGRIDLAVAANNYSSQTGRAYIFYNDGSIPTTAASADVTITGEASSYFGGSMIRGDFNADGRTDLAIGAYYYSGNYTGRAYIFYNDGSIPTTAASADVTITGEASSYFGYFMTSGDFNADGKTDLAVGAYGYSSYAGRAYIFYNDGSIPTTAASADVTITGEASGYFGYFMTSGDFNADGKTDLAVGTRNYSSNAGRVYIYETRDDYAWQVQAQPGQLNIDPKVGEVMKIQGEPGSHLGYSMVSGDFNADGKTDLAVGAYQYSSNAGRAYIFYNDGSVSTIAATADVIITGEVSSSFGRSMISGDFNADGKTDLAVGAYTYSSSAGRAYIFYNDGSIPITAAAADVVITGEASSGFGISMTSGDFNADGKIDLAVGAHNYSSQAGRAYIFYNDGSISATASTADIIITGQASDRFGISMASGDFNADGKTDLAVGAYSLSSDAGNVYIFYNDGSIPTAAASADVTITGEAVSSYFGYSMTSGDFNADGKTDLAVGAYNYSSITGRAYIFYNDGSIPTTAATADVIIAGEATNNYFGWSMTSGDFNADGKTDLAVGAYGYSSSTGRAYIFYNDGSIPTTAATADMIITGETTGNQFGMSMASGDFNADGKADLAVGANNYSSSIGQTYIYTFNDSQSVGQASGNRFGWSMASGDFDADGKTDLAVGAMYYTSNTGRVYIFYGKKPITASASDADVIITGETTNNYFGYSMISGDFNADSRTDLAVGARGYSTNAGRSYIFYNDGSIPSAASSADVAITGEAASNFGQSMASGDFNADGKIDLAIGAYAYSTNVGRSYIFYGDGSIPTAASSADVIIDGETTSLFGATIVGGDFNSDGKTDLAIGAYFINRAYIFYNDGSIPTNAGSADIIINGESGGFGSAMASGDFNFDGRIDLAVGAYSYSTNTGRAYIFYNDGSIPTAASAADAIITGEASSSFASSMVSGDFNADGKADLAVGAYLYSSNIGRVYILYNDSSYPANSSDADAIVTGESPSYFGWAITSGDFNADGRTDLAVGAYGYSSSAGKAYVIITEAKTDENINVVKPKGTVILKGGNVKLK